MARGWSHLLRSLGESLIGVAGAEAAALKGDLRASGRQLAIVVALAVAAVFFFFWVVGAAGFVLFHVMTIWLPGWGAAAVVLAVFILLTGLLAMVTRQRIRAIELPVDTVRRHIDDHVTWWHREVLGETGHGPERLEDEISDNQAKIPDMP